MVFSMNDTRTDLPVYRAPDVYPGPEWFMSGLCCGMAVMGLVWIVAAYIVG